MTPARGFDRSEYEGRVARAQARMAKAGIEALLLTTEPEVRYFTGYLTRFWESPTRPWFLLVPASGAPIAVIPSIGAELMGQTWVTDIRTWRAPDLEDDGASLLAETIREVVGDGGVVGLPDGHETHLRMPLADYARLGQAIGQRRLGSDQGILRALRMLKSPAEVEKIRHACAIGGRAYARVPEIAREGAPLDEIFRRFQMLCLEEGADWVPYVAGGADQGGYGDVISPARPVPLRRGDVLMLDTGLVWDGYFCDFDRNWSIGPASDAVKAAHAALIDSSEAGFAAAKPGATASDIYEAMNAPLMKAGGGTDAGRIGHGLGMSLTEWPSLIPTDHTPIEAGMVLTLEPGISVGSRIIVHEENILVTETGAEWLTTPAPAAIPEI